MWSPSPPSPLGTPASSPRPADLVLEWTAARPVAAPTEKRDAWAGGRSMRRRRRARGRRRREAQDLGGSGGGARRPPAANVGERRTILGARREGKGRRNTEVLGRGGGEGIGGEEGREEGRGTQGRESESLGFKPCLRRPKGPRHDPRGARGDRVGQASRRRATGRRGASSAPRFIEEWVADLCAVFIHP